MANVKITDLPEASPPDDDDVVPVTDVSIAEGRLAARKRAGRIFVRAESVRAAESFEAQIDTRGLEG